MEDFREMYLRGEPERLSETMEMISQALPAGWSRDRALEERLRRRPLGEERASYIFRTEPAGLLPNAELCVLECNEWEYRVSNIVPLDRPQLTFREYNSLLEEFCDRIARPCAERAGVSIELTSDQVALDQSLSETTYRKLLAFSTGANDRSTASRRDERRRWLDFVVTAQREGSRLPSRLLSRWLVEVGGRDPEEADRLAGEYEFGKEVLTFSNPEPAGV